METTEVVPPPSNPSSERYEEIKARLLSTNQPLVLKQQTKGIRARIWDFLKSFNVKGEPEIGHVPTLERTGVVPPTSPERQSH